MPNNGKGEPLILEGECANYKVFCRKLWARLIPNYLANDFIFRFLTNMVYFIAVSNMYQKYVSHPYSRC